MIANNEVHGERTNRTDWHIQMSGVVGDKQKIRYR